MVSVFLLISLFIIVYFRKKLLRNYKVIVNNIHCQYKCLQSIIKAYFCVFCYTLYHSVYVLDHIILV